MAPAQTRLDQIRDLVNQWEQLTGYTVSVPDWAVYEMADKVTSAGWVTNLFGLGQYMYDHAATQGQYHIDWSGGGNMPWAWYGMSATEYNAKLEAYDTSYRDLTGQGVPQDTIDKALKQHQGTMTSSQFQTWILSNEGIKNTYGWLKYGLDFQQFQTQKLQMRTSFGRDLSDHEAVTQLQYLHAAQGPNVTAGVVPTLTQTERKQANVGVGQSVVR